MINLFNILSNFFKENTTHTYGDILENKKDTMDDNMKRICNSEESEEYLEVKNFDKRRLLENCQLQQSGEIGKPAQQNIMGRRTNKTITVSGIGEVQQIC